MAAIASRRRSCPTPCGHVPLHPQPARCGGAAGAARIEVSHETIRCQTLKSWPLIAKKLHNRWPRPTSRWHIDEVQRRRNKKAALRLIRKLMNITGVQPETITTDKLGSYGAALRDLKVSHRLRCSGRRPTTGLRTATCPSDGESGRCRSSRAAAQPSAPCPPSSSPYLRYLAHLISRRGFRIPRADGHMPCGGLHSPEFMPYVK